MADTLAAKTCTPCKGGIPPQPVERPSARAKIYNSPQNQGYVKSPDRAIYDAPGFLRSTKVVAKRNNVKSRTKSATTDAHERAKDFLDEAEMERLLAAARTGRHGVRDHLLLLMMYRHGLRVSEAISLRWEHVNLERARLWVERLKGSLSVEHPITGDELRLVRKHLAGRDNQLPWLFVSERGAPLSRHAVNYLIAAAGDKAGIGHVHPHMLRHSCGYALADKGTDLRTMQDYLGHRDPGMTLRYTRIAARRFEGLWR